MTTPIHYSLRASVQSVQMTGIETPNNNIPILLSTIKGNGNCLLLLLLLLLFLLLLFIVYCYCLDDPLLSVSININPLNSIYNQCIRLSLLPVQVIYDGTTINNLLELLIPPTPLKLHTMSNSVTTTLATLRTQTRAGLEHAVNERKMVDMDITISSPIIYIPYNGVYNDTNDVLVINLGSLAIKSDMKHILPDVRVSVIVIVIVIVVIIIVVIIIEGNIRGINGSIL